MASLTTNNVYRITNKATGKALNCYNGNTTVNIFAEDGTKDQNWYFSNSRLFTEHYCTTKCLGKSGTTTPISTYSSSAGTTQGITAEIILTNTYGDYVEIKCGGSFLTNTGSTLSWTTSKSGTSSEWLCEKLIRTDMPGCGIDYFHTRCGVTADTFNASYASKLRTFASNCFNGATVSDSQLFYNAYGALMSGAGAANDAKFHLGIDMKPGGIVTAPFAGYVMQTTTNYGQVVLKNKATGKFFVFMHMSGIKVTKNETKEIAKGTPLGTMAGIGAGGASVFGAHLHVEVHSTNRTGQNAVGNSKNDMV